MPDFEDYQATLLSLLDKRWKPGKNRLKLRVVISFGVDKNGSIAWAKIRDGSGNSEHDESALKFVKDLAPLPQPPDSVSPETELAFNFDSNYEGDRPQGAGVPRTKGGPKPKANQEMIQAVAIFESED